MSENLNSKMFGLVPNEVKGLKYVFTALFVMLALAFMVMPVSAETEIMMSGSVAPTFSITVEPAYVQFPMVVGSNEIQSTWVNSTGNSGFEIKIRDTGAIAGFSNAGLKYLDGGGTPQAYMKNPLEAKLGTHAYVPITTADQTIYSGVAGMFNDRISYRQVVDITDRSTSGEARYWTKLTISGQAI